MIFKDFAGITEVHLPLVHVLQIDGIIKRFVVQLVTSGGFISISRNVAFNEVPYASCSICFRRMGCSSFNIFIDL